MLKGSEPVAKKILQGYKYVELAVPTASVRGEAFEAEAHLLTCAVKDMQSRYAMATGKGRLFNLTVSETKNWMSDAE